MPGVVVLGWEPKTGRCLLVRCHHAHRKPEMSCRTYCGDIVCLKMSHPGILCHAFVRDMLRLAFRDQCSRASLAMLPRPRPEGKLGYFNPPRSHPPRCQNGRQKAPPSV